MNLTRESAFEERTQALIHALMKRSQRNWMEDPMYRAPGARRFKNLQGENITATDTFTADTAQKYRLGTRGYTCDGRVYHYGLTGGVALAAGSLYQNAAPVAGNLAQTPAAAAIGVTQVTISTITTTVTANQYAEGFMQVDTTPGQGIMYGIASHNAATGGAGACTLVLYPDESIQVALTTSSRVGLLLNPYSGLILVPTTSTGLVAGIPSVAAAIASFAWIQTWGPCAALINGTPAVTAPVINSATTTGALDVWTAAAQPTATVVGRMMQVGVSTKNNAVCLSLKG